MLDDVNSTVWACSWSHPQAWMLGPRLWPGVRLQLKVVHQWYPFLELLHPIWITVLCCTWGCLWKPQQTQNAVVKLLTGAAYSDHKTPVTKTPLAASLVPDTMQSAFKKKLIKP